MFFNTKQIFEVLEIVNRFHIQFIIKQVGYDILPESDKKILKSVGFNEVDFSSMGKIEENFRFGMLSTAIKESKLKKLNYKDFKKFLSSQQFLPLNEVEREALNAIKFQSYQDIKGLGERVSKDLSHIIIDKQKRARAERVIRTEAEKAILNRLNVKELSLEIAKKTGNWLKDWDRVSDYILHEAYDWGRAMNILKTRGKDALVYKSVFPQACEGCQKAYLTRGIGSRPIIFRLKDLIENGDNIGKMKGLARPVLGPFHPRCRCTLQEVPKGFVYNPEKKDFSKPIEILRRTKSKIKISINGKEID